MNKLVEEIAIIIHFAGVPTAMVGAQDRVDAVWFWGDIAKDILSLPNIIEIDPDAEMPKVPLCSHKREITAYLRVQQDMLNEGWFKKKVDK